MGLFDALFNHFSANQMSQMNFEHSKALQQHQFDLNKRALQEFYTNNRKSLVDAGYNPLLAVPGSTAQGFSASASMSSSPGSASGLGTDEVNSVTSAMNAVQQRKVAKQQVKQSEEQTKSLELDNKKKLLDLKTNPKNLIVDKLEGKTLPTYIQNGIQKLKGLGIDITPTSAKSNISKGGNLIQLHDGKPYVQKGVPKSVVKSFSGGVSALDKISRYPDFVKTNLSQAQKSFIGKSKKHHNKPPKNFPSGM